ncbi:MAG: acyl-CoA/acyl-ACP dehydrogenase [Deltaproteobacteria bacterium]|nr:acyl-CoA/acyl-ACP dehydrogenase [Deltaproteobacteria bacterium]
MDFELEWQQEELKRTARNFLRKTCSLENLLEAEESTTGFSLSAYREMGRLGWLEVGLPSDRGGSGDFIDSLVLYEEFGRAALPGPHFVSSFLGGQILLALGGPTHQDQLQRVTTGEWITTVALYEETADYEPHSVRLCVETKDSYVSLTGRKLFVPFAHVCDFLIVLARTGPKPEQLTFYVVPRDTRGLEITPLQTISGEKQCVVEFTNVILAADAMLGPLNSGWETLQSLLPRATVLQASELVGIADAALEMAVEYAKQRIAFGRPIGSFQAIQHKCAEMVTERDAARFLTYQAACFIKMGEPLRAEVAMAKAFAGTAARRVTKEAHQIFGGAGYIKQNRLNFYYRRAKGIELALGDVNEQLRVIGDRWCP